MSLDEPVPHHDAEHLLGGVPIGRRALLRLAAGAALGLPFVLSACGTKEQVAAFRSDYVINFVGHVPPLDDLGRLLTDRAHDQRMAPKLVLGGIIGLPMRLSGQSLLRPFDPVTNTTPPAYALLVVPAIDQAAVEPLLATAAGRGVKIVAYAAPLRHQDAAIVVDGAQAATTLAKDAAAWARAHTGGKGDVLLVLPRASEIARDPFASADIGPTLRETLTREAPGLRVAASVTALRGAVPAFVAHALAQHRKVGFVLAWDDALAVDAARALRAAHPGASHSGLYVGAIGSPAVTSQATFRELDRDDVLRVVVASGARDIADAMVDLPRAVLRGASPGNLRLPSYTLTPGSPALARYRKDYALRPSGKNYDGGVLLNNPNE